jgi:hypothetical protein
MTDEQKFAVAFLAGCAIDTASVERTEQGDYRYVLKTRYPVEVVELNGKFHVYEFRGARG